MYEILVVEDDADTNADVTGLLKSIPDVRVQSVLTRQDALDLIGQNAFDLAIVDLDLGPEPGRPGRYAGIGVILALGKTDTVTIVVSGLTETAMPDVVLELRAFDFVGKPFRHSDLLNKVHHGLALKKVSVADEVDQIGDSLRHSKLQLDPKRVPGLLWRGQRVRLSLTQYRLMFRLLETPGLVVTREALVDAMDSTNSKGALATHFSEIRSKFLEIDDSFNAIRNEPGRGYVWQEGD